MTRNGQKLLSPPSDRQHSVSPSTRVPTVVVLGGAYGGAAAVKVLSAGLPSGWRLVVIDRNTHMNHVYVFPRFAVMPQHAPKGFIPFNGLFASPTAADASAPGLAASGSPQSSAAATFGTRVFIRGEIVSLSRRQLTFTRLDDRTKSDTIETLDFDYCVHALGSGMPSPVNTWSRPSVAWGDPLSKEGQNEVGTKRYGILWLQQQGGQLRRARSIIVVGAGPLGIQFATDLKEVYPEKTITLLHSRTRLLPLYPFELHTAVLRRLQTLGVEVVLGTRVVTWPEAPDILDGRTKVVFTGSDTTLEADLVLPCTGQRPNAGLFAEFAPRAICPITGRIRVRPTLQVLAASTKLDNQSERVLVQSHDRVVDTAPGGSIVALTNVVQESDLSHFFAVGDCAESGAVQAGHTAHHQGEIAGRNILRLIQAGAMGARQLEEYSPTQPAIKLSLGLKSYASSLDGVVAVGEDGVEDLQADFMWRVFNVGHLDEQA